MEQIGPINRYPSRDDNKVVVILSYIYLHVYPLYSTVYIVALYMICMYSNHMSM